MTIEAVKTANGYRKYHLTHLRNLEALPNGEIAIAPKGGVTVAYRVSPGVNENNYPAIIVEYGIAVCSLEDRYIRKDGRNCAMGRADAAVAGRGADLSIFTRPINPNSHFSGNGRLVLDLPPTLIYPSEELVPSRFLHVSIVRAILTDAIDQVLLIMATTEEKRRPIGLESLVYDLNPVVYEAINPLTSNLKETV